MIIPSSIKECFQLDGPTAVRGFKIGDLGPRNGGNSMGGDDTTFLYWTHCPKLFLSQSKLRSDSFQIPAEAFTKDLATRP